jgi:hypothetical protein
MSYFAHFYLSVLGRGAGATCDYAASTFTTSVLALQPPSLAMSVIDAAAATKLSVFIDNTLVEKWEKLYTTAELDNPPPHDACALAARIFLQQAWLFEYADLTVKTEWTNSEEKTKFEVYLAKTTGELLEQEFKALAVIVQFGNSGISAGQLFQDITRLDVGMGLIKYVPSEMLRSNEWFTWFDMDNLPDDFDAFTDILLECIEELESSPANCCQTTTTNGRFQITTLTREAAATLAPKVYSRMCTKFVLNAPTLCRDVGVIVDAAVADMEY